MQWEGVMAQRFLVVTAMLSAILVAGCGERRSSMPPAGEDGVVFMDDEAPAMRAAYARARATLDDFLAIVREPPPNLTGIAVKVGLPAGDETEYVWIGDFSEQGDGRFTGTINNDVAMATSYKLGDPYSFRKSDIVDWVYVDDQEQKMYGNHTMCALLTEEPPEAAARAKAAYKLDCPP
jgi:uncharacterized protein YegJ (DUF2314 family)